MNIKQQANATRFKEVLARQQLETGTKTARRFRRDARPAFEAYVHEVDKQVDQLNRLLKDSRKRLRKLLLFANGFLPAEHCGPCNELQSEVRKLASRRNR